MGPADASSPASATGWPTAKTMPAAVPRSPWGSASIGLPGPVDLPGQGVAGGGISGSLGAARRGQVLLLDVYLDRIAERLDPGEPRSRLAPERRRRAGWLAPGDRRRLDGHDGAAERDVAPPGDGERSTHGTLDCR